MAGPFQIQLTRACHAEGVLVTFRSATAVPGPSLKWVQSGVRSAPARCLSRRRRLPRLARGEVLVLSIVL
ncbi:MAG: hypothetical protein DMF92_15025 [Acidobacteria bacterium]|nr:MAG: hypothetical protein DMF92_15025 [Acidobacteriota bacterium]